MKLTGKCKKDFEKWYQLTDFKCKTQPDIIWFYRLSKSMQYGVYVDFFDSVEIDICIYFGDVGGYEVHIYSKGYKNIGTFKKRQEARIKAIEKANEIYNDTKIN